MFVFIDERLRYWEVSNVWVVELGIRLIWILFVFWLFVVLILSILLGVKKLAFKLGIKKFNYVV